MSTFISSLSELAALIFQSFRLPMLLPAIAFVLAQAAVVLPGLKDKPLGRIYYAHDPQSQSLLLIILVAFVTYLLTVLNHSIIRFLEGYTLPQQVPFFKKRQEQYRHHYSYLVKRRDQLQLDIYVTQSPSPGTPAYDALLLEYRGVMTELTAYFPDASEKILPTRFGNVIACAEDYPYKLYGVDSVVMWPMLVPLLSENGYAKFIEREKGYLDFLLNTLLLSDVLGVELILVGFVNGKVLAAIPQLLAIVATSVVLYGLSIDAAMGWGYTIRTSFDLYRDHLRQALRIRRPSGFEQEQTYWRQASQFYGYRHDVFGAEIFDYSKEAFQPYASQPKRDKT